MKRLRSIGVASALVAAVLVFAFASPAFAQEVKFTAELDQREYYQDDTIILTVEVSVPRQGGVAPRMPDWQPLRQISKSQSQRTQMQMGGGGATVVSTTTYTYGLRASRPGRYTIKPGQLSWGGKKYQTSPLTLTVKEGKRPGGQRQQARRGQRVDPFDDFFGRRQQPRQQSGGARDLILLAELDPPEVYVGQESTMTIKLLHRVGFTNDISLKMPQLQGVWAEALDRPRRAERRRQYQGVSYTESIIARQSLFPLRAGEHTISAVKISGTAMTGGFFGKRVNVSSDPIKLRAKPLPKKDRPPGFNENNVGTWQLRAEVDRLKVDLSEPVTLRIIAQGSGNVSNLALPEIPTLEHLKVYPPTVSETVNRSGRRLSGQRKAEYLLLPSSSGTVRLPSLVMNTFNPATGRYQAVSTQPIELRVTGAGKEGIAVGSRNQQTQGLNVLQSGFRPIRYDSKLDGSDEPLHRRGVYWLFVVMPPFLLFGLWGVDRFRAFSDRIAPRNIPRRAVTRAREALAALKGQVGSGEAEDGSAELSRIILTFLHERFGRPAVGLTQEEVRALVVEGGFPDEVAGRVVAELEACDFARFAPAGSRESELRSAIERTDALVGELETPQSA